MKVAWMVLVLLAASQCEMAYAARTEPVSLLRLIADPASFDGHRVSTMGVLRVRDVITLCIDEGSADAGVSLNCLVLQQDDGQIAASGVAGLDGQCVQVAGVFDVSEPRSRGFEGVLREIYFIARIGE